MKYLIGLDIGTSSIKGMLMSEDAKHRVTGKEVFTYTYGDNGSIEITPERYLTACYALLKTLSAAMPADGELCGVSAASASGNLLLIGKDGNPSTNIFNWQDSRVTDETTKVLGQDFDSEAYYRVVGWPYIPTGFPLADLCWLKCHKPQLLEECSKVCMSTEYLCYTLTGKWGISGSAGSPFYLIDQQSGEYIKKTLNTFGICEEKLPVVGKAGDLLGTVNEKASKETGLPVGTPIYLGTFDHPSAARGAGVLNEGQMLLSCGTSWVCFYPVKEREKAVENHMIVDPFLSSKGGCWAGMASVASLSAHIERYIRRYIANEGNVFLQFAAESAKSEPGAGGLVIDLLADNYADNIETYPKHHIARAIMEATVRLLSEKIDALKAGGVEANSAVMVGGPSECPIWADIIEQMTGISVRIMHGSYAGALGAAMVAGVSAGIYSDISSAGEFIRKCEESGE